MNTNAYTNFKFRVTPILIALLAATWNSWSTPVDCCCVEYGPHWYVSGDPQIETNVLFVPEPGLTNETMSIVGYVTADSGTLTGTYDCSASQSSAAWPLVLQIAPWSAHLLPTVIGISGSATPDGLVACHTNWTESISFASPYPGDGLVSVTVRGTNSFGANNYIYFPPFVPSYVPFSILPRERLVSFLFNTATLAGDGGQLPTNAVNISRVPAPFGRGILFDSAQDIDLKYPAFQNDAFSVLNGDGSEIYSTGSPNVRFNEGSMSFWFSPDWSSGNGPNNGVILQMAGRTIQFANNGANLKIDGNSFPINFTVGQWYQIVVTYSANNSFVFTNGVQAGTSGSGVSQTAANVLSTFRIGSDGSSGQVRGIMARVQTFNYAMPASEVLSNYQVDCDIDADGDGISDLQEFESGTDPEDPPGGNPVSISPPAQDPNDTTPPVIHLLEPINAVQQ